MRNIISCILISALVLSFTGCGNNSSSTTAATTNTVTQEKVYAAGEEAFILDNNGNKVYSLKINGAKVANDFEYKSDFSAAKQVIELDYTYSNISQTKAPLQIHTQDLQVIDSSGSIAESSSMFPKQHPQAVEVGVNCGVQGYYGLANESKKIKVNFRSQSYPKAGVLTFEIDIK